MYDVPKPIILSADRLHIYVETLSVHAELHSVQ